MADINTRFKDLGCGLMFCIPLIMWLFPSIRLPGILMLIFLFFYFAARYSELQHRGANNSTGTGRQRLGIRHSVFGVLTDSYGNSRDTVARIQYSKLNISKAGEEIHVALMCLLGYVTGEGRKTAMEEEVFVNAVISSFLDADTEKLREAFARGKSSDTIPYREIYFLKRSLNGGEDLNVVLGYLARIIQADGNVSSEELSRIRTVGKSLGLYEAEIDSFFYLDANAYTPAPVIRTPAGNHVETGNYAETATGTSENSSGTPVGYGKAMRILGLKQKSTNEQITARYKQLMQKYNLHDCRNGMRRVEYTRKREQLTKAYEAVRKMRRF